MMGITATASAVIYLLRDEIDPFIAGPCARGVRGGHRSARASSHRIDPRRAADAVRGRACSTPHSQMAIKALGLLTATTSRAPGPPDAAYALEAVIGRLLVAGTWLAMGLVADRRGADARERCPPARARAASRRSTSATIPADIVAAAGRRASCGSGIVVVIAHCPSDGSSSRGVGFWRRRRAPAWLSSALVVLVVVALGRSSPALGRLEG